ncbi:MAG: hypothetical protein JWO06_992 [Bacteroidota bacterium]|nr:hypothetical protein [Bacteroidota bacterium]
MKKIILHAFLSLVALGCAAQTYTILGQGNSAIYYDSYILGLAIDGQGNIYAGCGNATHSFGFGFVEKWDGTTWSGLPLITDTAHCQDVWAVATDAANNVYVGGDFNDLGTGSLGGFYTSKWNGTTWTELENAGNPHFNNGSLLALTCSGTNVYATQFLDTFNGPTFYYVAKWDGANWTEPGASTTPLHVDSSILVLAHDNAGNIYAGGQFADSTGKKYIAKFNGSGWSNLGNLNVNANILSIATDAAGNVYAGGVFTDGASKTYVAKWDGNTWSDLGNSASVLGYGYLASVATDPAGNVYAAGYLRDNFGFFVAKWNGISWAKLYTDTVQFSLVATDAQGNVYGARQGIYITGQPAHGYVAKLNFAATGVEDIADNVLQVKLYPNPANDVLQILSDTKFETIEVYSALGQVVLKAEDSQTALNIAALTNGMYTAKLQTASGKTAVAKFCKE